MAEDIGDVGVNVVTDFRGFEEQLRRMLMRMEAENRARIRVDPQLAQAQDRMRIWRAFEERALEIRVKIQEKSLAIAKEKLATFTGLNALTQSFNNFNEHVTDLFNNIIPIGMKIGRIGAYAGPASVLVGELTTSVVNLGKQAGAGLLALPGILAFAGTSMYVFKGAMQDATKVLGPAITQYKQLRQVVSYNFWAFAAQPVKDLLNNVFPALKEGFANMAGSAGDFTGKLAKAFEKTLSPDRVKGIFGNFAKGFDVLAEKAAGPFANITANLLDWGSTLIPKLADAFGGMLARFDTWLDKAIKTGDLTRAFDGLIQTIKDAWKVLSDVWHILQNVSDAAKKAGIGAFPLVGILDGISKATDTPGFKKGLTDFFEGAKRGADGMKQAWGPLKGLIAGLEPIISHFIGEAGQKVGAFFGKLFTAMSDPKFLGNVSSMLDGFLKIFDNLNPAIGPFVDKLGSLAHFAGVLADSVSGTLGKAIEVLAPLFGKVLEQVEPLTKALGEFGKQGLEGWKEPLAKIGDGFGNLISGVTTFVEALNTPVIRFILNLIIDFISTAIDGFANLLGGVLKIVGGLMKLLSGDWSGLKDIWDGFMMGIKGAWELFITLFAPAKILGFLGKLAKPLLDLLGPMLKPIGDLIGKGLGGIGKFLMEALSNVPGLVGKFFTDMIAKAGTFISSQAGSLGKFLIDGLIKGAQALIGGFLVYIWNPILDGIKNFFGIHSPSTVFEELGNNLIQGLINGIQALINGVVTIFTAVFEGIKAVVMGVINVLVAIFQMWWQGVQIGFQMIGAVATAIWNSILAVGQVVWNTIQAVVQTVINIIVDIINGLLATATNIWNSILSTAQGAWDGIVAGANGLVEGIKGVLGGIGDVVGGIFNGVKSTVEGIWNSIQLPNILGGLGIPGFASGVDNFGGGLAVVGEQGPELVRLPKGSTVYPSEKSKGMLSNVKAPQPVAAQTTGQGFTFAPTINNPVRETSEQSLFKSAQSLTYLGLV